MAIITRTLSCGLPLIIEPNTNVRSAAVMWLIPAGIGSDPADRIGLAPVITELLMRGSTTLDSRAQADAFDLLGASRSVSAGGTFVRVSAGFIGDRCPAVLDLLVDMVRRPLFAAEALEPTRELALQSLAGLKDEPVERAGHIMLDRHLPLPINRSDLGTEAGLKAITLSDVVKKWQQRALPVGSILAIAGNVDADAIAAQLDRALSSWSGTAAPLKLEPNPNAGTYHHETEQSNQTHIFLSHDAPAEGSKDVALERVVASVLSGGSSCRLFTEVRERRGLCYSVSASYAAEKDFGRVGCYVGTTPEKAQQSIDVMHAELCKLMGGGNVEREEFDRALVGARTRLVFAGESMAARATSLASDFYRLGRARTLDELAAEMQAITVPQVNDYLTRRGFGSTSVVTLGPSPLTMPASLALKA